MSDKVVAFKIGVSIICRFEQPTKGRAAGDEAVATLEFRTGRIITMKLTDSWARFDSETGPGV